MSTPLTSVSLAAQLGLPHQGPPTAIVRPASLNSAAPGTLLFAKKYDEAIVARLNALTGATVIALPEYAGKLAIAHLVSSNPRLDFSRALELHFSPVAVPGVDPTARLDATVKLGKDVTIGAFCRISGDVTIGDGTVIGSHVVIEPNTRIGAYCIIRSMTVIGDAGFGFTRDSAGVPRRLPHVGGVRIGDDVEIGNLNTVARGTLDDTIVEDHVKTDAHVHIAHNDRIGAGSILTAGAIIAGSTTLGARNWLSPNCTLLNGLTLGQEVFVGIAALVAKDVEDRQLVIGNPGRARALPEDLTT